jgi:hypothetical protein
LHGEVLGIERGVPDQASTSSMRLRQRGGQTGGSMAWGTLDTRAMLATWTTPRTWLRNLPAYPPRREERTILQEGRRLYQGRDLAARPIRGSAHRVSREMMICPCPRSKVTSLTCSLPLQPKGKTEDGIEGKIRPQSLATCRASRESL